MDGWTGFQSCYLNLAFISVYTAKFGFDEIMFQYVCFLPSMLCIIHGLCHYAVSIYPSVASMYSVETSKNVFKIFHNWVTTSSSLYPVLVFMVLRLSRTPG